MYTSSEETIQIKGYSSMKLGSVNSPHHVNEYAHETLRRAWTNTFTSPNSLTSCESFFHLSAQRISSERSGKYIDFSLTNLRSLSVTVNILFHWRNYRCNGKVNPYFVVTNSGSLNDTQYHFCFLQVNWLCFLLWCFF